MANCFELDLPQYKQSLRDCCGFLDNLQFRRDTLQTPIILATSLSENVAYRFTGLDREVPIIWKINIPRKELQHISGTIFEREDYNIDLSRPLANKEFEVILPMDSILKFKGELLGIYEKNEELEKILR